MCVGISGSIGSAVGSAVILALFSPVNEARKDEKDALFLVGLRSLTAIARATLGRMISAMLARAEPRLMMLEMLARFEPLFRPVRCEPRPVELSLVLPDCSDGARSVTSLNESFGCRASATL